MKQARSYRDLFVNGETDLEKIRGDIRVLTLQESARQRLQETLEAMFGKATLVTMSEKEIAATLDALPKRRCDYCAQPRPVLVGSNGLKVLLCNVCQRADAANGPETRDPATPVIDAR